jgi:hypothetical protein
MKYIDKALIIASLLVFSAAHSAETQFLDDMLSELDFNQFIVLPENQEKLEIFSIVNYRDYEQALYNYYHSPLGGSLRIRTPENFQGLKSRHTEQWIPDVDKVKDYVGHIRYVMSKSRGG